MVSEGSEGASIIHFQGVTLCDILHRDIASDAHTRFHDVVADGFASCRLHRASFMSWIESMTDPTVVIRDPAFGS